MDIRLSQCFVAVDDHDKALAFHPDVLGLRDPAGNMLRFAQRPGE
jgi:hypothetical protein